MIPILYTSEAFDALFDVNANALQDTEAIQLQALSPNVVREYEENGFGYLTDCISCEVTEERNGMYELEMLYPITGIHFDEMELRSIILAKPNFGDNPQPFRIYYISSPIDGVATIRCRHISYDLGGVPLDLFKATSAGDACEKMMQHSMIEHPFTIRTTVPTYADFEVTEPTSVRNWFGGRTGSMLDVYGGEWHYDGYVVTLERERGTDRGVVIQYGKNLVDFEQEQNCESVYTDVLPYWKSYEDKIVQGNLISVGNFPYTRVLSLDLSMDFQEEPTVEQLNDRAAVYIKQNNVGVPKVNIALDWVQASELFDRVDLCDTVTIVYEAIGVRAKAKCILTIWDVLAERYSYIEIGEPRATFATMLADLSISEDKRKTSVSEVVLNAIANATALITGNKGGYVIMHDGDGDGEPDEILIMDTNDIKTATKVWRWNLNGLGYSNTGYNGSFGTAITMDGQIVADYITAGTLEGVNITGVNITGSSVTGGTVTGATINNGSGSFTVDESGNVTASKMAITGGYINLDTENMAQGLTLRNSNSSVYTVHSAATRRRYRDGELVLGESDGNISAKSFINISDARRKTILQNDVPDMSKIRAVCFKWNSGDDAREHIGYIAQDVQSVAPEMVQDNDGTLSLDYIQLLTAKVEYLERKLEQIEKRTEDDGR